MKTINATKARANIYKLLEEANSSNEPIQITGKRNNAILISEDDWRAIEETLYLLSIPGMLIFRLWASLWVGCPFKCKSSKL